MIGRDGKGDLTVVYSDSIIRDGPLGLFADENTTGMWYLREVTPHLHGMHQSNGC